MCGIAGYVGRFTEQQLHTMVATLRHRGPDDEGTYINPEHGVGLGHTRLSIIDLGGGNQPMCNEDGTLWLIFNGEIYNHLELRRSLTQAHEFRTDCDTEVILHLYEEHGESCVGLLSGMFAFALWDERSRKLFVARDRFGIKPLYVAATGRGFAFASEAKALIEAGIVEPRVDEEAIGPYLTFRYVPEDRTMFDGIHKLLPGHIGRVTQAGFSTSQYWAPSFEKVDRGDPERYVEEFTELLKRAVDMRLMSEVPLGAFLSGGLDSSFLVALMAELKDDPVETFTAALDGRWHDESEYAAIVAKAFATNHHPLRVRPDATAALQKVVWHLDEPLADAATIPTFLLSELTREFVTVVLSGEGADELLAGYGKYQALALGHVVRRIFGGKAWGALSRVPGARIGIRRSASFLSQGADARAYMEFSGVFDTREKEALLAPGKRHLAAPEPTEAVIGKYFHKNGERLDPLDQMISLDVGTWLPNDVLLKVDKMSMAHSLEARVPFLEHELAEFMFALPKFTKMKGLQNKVLLRQAMTGIVPREIVKRKKHGFTVPVKRWMEGALRPMVEKAFSKDRAAELGYWNHSFMTRLLRRDLNNEFYRRQVWTLLTFDAWHRVFIEGDRSGLS